MTPVRLSALALVSSLLFVLLGSQNGLFTSGTLLSADPDVGISPENLPPEDENQPRRRTNWLQRAFRGTSQIAGRILGNFRNLLSRRSRVEAEQELKSLEATSIRYFDCFSLASPETKAASAVSSVCGRMKTEALRRNCSLFAYFIAKTLAKIGDCISQGDPANYTQKRECLGLYRLFLVHPLLRESISAASAEDINDAEAWMNTLGFTGGPPEEFTFPGGSPLGKAFAALNWSMVGTVDNLHIVAGNALKASTRQRRGVGGRWRRFWRRVRGRSSPMTETVKPNAEALLNQGYELFLSMPPHPDPVAVRLLVAMLADGLSCPADGTFGKPERVVVGGKIKNVKTAQMIEAAIYVFVEVLFDASDCAARDNAESQARMTCKLLNAYDEYMQAGGPMQARRTVEEGLQGTESADLEPGPAPAEGTPKNEGELSPGLEAREPPSTQSSEIPSTLPSEANVGGLADISRGTEEGPPEISLEAPTDQGLEVEDGRSDRIRVYAQNATASAVAAARLSLKSSSATLRIVRLCLRSALFVRYASRILLFFLGKELVSSQGLFLLLGRDRQGERLLGLHVKALVELSSGNVNLGNLSAAAAGIAANEETRIVSGEQQTSVSFLQGWLKPTAVARTFQAAGVRVSRQTAIALALSVNVSADIVLAFLLVALSTAFPPAVIALAVVMAILLIIRSAVISFTVAVPETLIEKAERKGRGALDRIAKAVG